MNTIQLSSFVTASLLSFSAFATTPKQPSIYDEMMAKTIGQYKISDQNYNYNVTGQLNYVYGFNELDTGFHNSNLAFNTSTSLRNGINLILETGAKEVYKLKSDDYDTKVNSALKLSKDNHEIQLGYDMLLANKILGSKVHVNGDTTLTRNVIGQVLSNYAGFGTYDFSFRNYNVSAALDFDGNLYAGLSAYADNTDIKLHIFEINDDLGAFVDIGTVFQDGLKASAGIGLIEQRFSFSMDVSYFMSEAISLYGNVIGDEDHSTATIGTGYRHNSLTLYAEGIVELSNINEKFSPQNGVMLGAKFMF